MQSTLNRIARTLQHQAASGERTTVNFDRSRETSSKNGSSGPRSPGLGLEQGAWLGRKEYGLLMCE